MKEKENLESCWDGRVANVKLTCGHWTCSWCVCEQRYEMSLREREYITCEYCGGIPTEVSKI